MEYIFEEIRSERKRQDKKWGEQNHSPVVFCGILGEEVGEVNKAAIENHFFGAPIKDYRDELIQVAAVAVQMIEAVDRRKP